MLCGLSRSVSLGFHIFASSKPVFNYPFLSSLSGSGEDGVREWACEDDQTKSFHCFC